MDTTSLLPPSGHPARKAAYALLAFAPVFFGALALALGQDANWDLRNYHWYNAYAFLNDRYGTDFLPSQTPYFYNPTLDVPFYLLASHASARVAGFMLGFVQGINFILLFILGHRILNIINPWRKFSVCAIIATLGMLGGGGIALLGTTFYDNVTSLGVFTSALLIIHFRNDLVRLPIKRALLLALFFGIPAGLMMGLKLPCVIFCFGFCFGIFALGGDRARELKEIHIFGDTSGFSQADITTLTHILAALRLFFIALGFGIGVLLGCAITLGHWAWFLDTYYGSPFFPYFNDFFKSPFAPEVSARDVKFIQHGFWKNIFFPFRFAFNPYLVGEIDWRDWSIPILYALLPVTLFLRIFIKRDPGRPTAPAYATRYLLTAISISYVTWLFMFCIYRYAVPLEMLAPLLIVLTAGLLPFKLPTRAAVIACLLILSAVSVESGNWTRRESWLDHFIEVTIPHLPDDDIMVLMTGYEPYSHVISEFPPTMSFVRIQSNFAGPDENKGINRVILRRVQNHNGPYMLLIPQSDWEMTQAQLALNHFALIIREPCQTVTDRLYGDTSLSLCPLARVRAK